MMMIIPRMSILAKSKNKNRLPNSARTRMTTRIITRMGTRILARTIVLYILEIMKTRMESFMVSLSNQVIPKVQQI